MTRRGVRTWIIRISIALLLGAATTVAVTWAIVLTAERTTRSHDASVTRDDHFPTWRCTIWDHGTAMSVNYSPVYAERNVMPDMSLRVGREDYIRDSERLRRVMQRSFWTFSKPPPEPKPDFGELNYVWYNETAIGWPMWAMKSRWRADGRRRTPDRGFLQERYWSLEVAWRGGKRALPLRPIWSGFLFNTTLAAIFWLLLIALLVDGLRAARRAIRKRRNRCFKCGYHLHGLPEDRPCPECGTAP